MEVNMKNAVLLGDSIRISYQLTVKSLLAGKADVLYPEENCRWAGYTLNSLRYWLPNLPTNPDVIHWNNGIWDSVVLYPEDGPFITVENYVRDIMCVASTTAQVRSTGQMFLLPV